MLFILTDEVGQAPSKMKCLSLGLKDEVFEGGKTFWDEITRHVLGQYRQCQIVFPDFCPVCRCGVG